MSDTPRTDEAERQFFGGHPAIIGLARLLERELAEANRWRSVAEQAEKALEMTQFGALGKRRCPVCAGWNVGPNGETDKVHAKDCPVSLALSAFDSLRKEGTGE